MVIVVGCEACLDVGFTLALFCCLLLRCCSWYVVLSVWVIVTGLHVCLVSFETGCCIWLNLTIGLVCWGFDSGCCLLIAFAGICFDVLMACGDGWLFNCCFVWLLASLLL